MCSLVADSDLDIALRQLKYLNRFFEQDHRAVYRRDRQMMVFKPFGPATKLIAGIETLQMIKKGQMRQPEVFAVSATASV